MTCKDCISFEACSFRNSLPIFYGESDSDDIYDTMETACKAFKDKSKFIELPCSIDKNQSLQEYMNNLNSISYEDLEIALKQIEYGNYIIRKWLIDNNCLEVT